MAGWGMGRLFKERMMGRRWNRRKLFKAGVAAGVGAIGPAGAVTYAPAIHRPRMARPVAISSLNGMKAVQIAVEMVRDGSDTLDAVVAGVNPVEEDPRDTSVGYGGLPNEDGIVQLDSSVMHGPTRRGGAVAAIQGVKTPSKVAKLVLERTDHVLIVGEGAARFAEAHGFKREDLLTDRAREVWLRWKENLSERDDWLSPKEAEIVAGTEFAAFVRDHGTINCNVVDANGDISGVTTTSGLAFKIPGRVGDSPILGAGLYVDNDIGACGSTGRGEANLLDCCSFLIVENMRRGAHPKDACIETLKRVARKTVASRLLTDDGRPNFGLSFYALNKQGEYAGATIWGEVNGRTTQFSVNDGGESRAEDCVALYDARSD